MKSWGKNSVLAIKIGVDIAMTAALLLLMTYERIGAAAHEWLGIGLFVLFILHHLLNRGWHTSLARGRYTALRIWQTTLVVLALLAMLGAMVSGAILSGHALRFLPISGGRGFGRMLHMLSAWWGLVVFGLHLGFHWQMLCGIAKKQAKGPAKPQKSGSFRAGHAAAAVIAVYGVYAFARQNAAEYLFLRTHFAFFDFEEPLALLLLDYAAILALFVLLGHCLTRLLRRGSKNNPAKERT